MVLSVDSSFIAEYTMCCHCVALVNNASNPFLCPSLRLSNRPLDDALESDSLEAVQLLFRFGANPSCAQNAANLKVPEDTDCAKLFLGNLQ